MPTQICQQEGIIKIFELGDGVDIEAFDLGPLDDGPDISVYVPGPAGPPTTDVGTFLAPVVVTGTIAAPVFRNQRSFIKATAPVDQPDLPNPSDNGAWQLCLFVTAGSSPITLNNASNLKLSGQWIGNPDSILYLQWDGNSRYVESGRNEI